jgi:hypothetical protein
MDSWLLLPISFCLLLKKAFVFSNQPPTIKVPPYESAWRGGAHRQRRVHLIHVSNAEEAFYSVSLMAVSVPVTLLF